MGYIENGLEVGDLAEHRRKNEILEHNQRLQERYPVYQHQESENEEYLECENEYKAGTWCS